MLLTHFAFLIAIHLSFCDSFLLLYIIIDKEIVLTFNKNITSKLKIFTIRGFGVKKSNINDG